MLQMINNPGLLPPNYQILSDKYTKLVNGIGTAVTKVITFSIMTT